MVESRSLILFVPRAMREAAKVLSAASSLTTTGQPLTLFLRFHKRSMIHEHLFFQIIAWVAS